jgi:hypothetical protein
MKLLALEEMIIIDAIELYSEYMKLNDVNKDILNTIYQINKNNIK